MWMDLEGSLGGCTNFTHMLGSGHIINLLVVPSKEPICILQPRMGGFEELGETSLLSTDVPGGGSTIIESTFLPIVQWLHCQTGVHDS